MKVLILILIVRLLVIHTQLPPPLALPVHRLPVCAETPWRFKPRSGQRFGDGIRGINTDATMDAAEVFVEVLFAREARAGAAFAVAVGTHARRLGATVLLVNFALVAEQTAGVGEALDLLAAGLFTDVRAQVLVHVFSVGIIR